MPIHQTILIASGPALVYAALTRADQFAEMTGAPAEIDPTEGGKFSCFGGAISGRTLEMIEGERLVQAWRVKDWEPGVYSIVKFDLSQVNEKETRILFEHIGYPVEHEDHLEQGWHDNYWEPLKKSLES